MAATALSPSLRLSAHSFASCSGRAESRPSSQPCGAFTPARLSNRSSILSVSGQQVIAGRGVVTKRRENGSGVRAAFPGLGDDYLIPGEYDISSIPSEFRRENLPEELKQNYSNVPSSMFGLTTSQMDMFIDEDSAISRTKTDPSKLRASAYYKTGGAWSPEMAAGGVVRPKANMGLSTNMYRGGGGYGRPKTAPPDLPSLLLGARICYLGMPIVPAVTELIVAELLWLNYDSKDKPIYFYINSPGTQNEQKESIGFETEAYAIADTLLYVKPKIHTLVIGHAFGQAAMLLSLGTKGHRFALPNSRMKIYSPKVNRSSGSAIDMWIKAKELEANTKYYTRLLAFGTGKKPEEVREDIKRIKYFDAKEAIEYGLVDKVVEDSKLQAEKRDYDQMMLEGKKMRGEVVKPGQSSGLVKAKPSGPRPSPAVR
ncbi:Clp protease proteolytic subunit [Klebsormidium nitens]|uniref:ATP-dependent Clp protease proteolytic subunit n=1 Tax=Klebsormidium nitens TaxID=105231 RepID=A0A1Y1HRR6_KLENI|nr:Clp protease proteolytic subunit [Klebsormidium nitens]|eukprot:GAQ80783.1 Clp protease proteolytic subunit [Klebsormidium nitens]